MNIFTAWAEWRKRRKIHAGKFEWRCYAYGGGGGFTTPPLNRAKAIEYLKKAGRALCYVDDENKMLFYR